MKPNLKTKTKTKTKTLEIPIYKDEDDDDFQNPKEALAITQNLILSSIQNQNPNFSSNCLKPKTSNGSHIPRKKQKASISNAKENRIAMGEKRGLLLSSFDKNESKNLKNEENSSDLLRDSNNLEERNAVGEKRSQLFDSTENENENDFSVVSSIIPNDSTTSEKIADEESEEDTMCLKKGYFSKSIESRLLKSREESNDFEPGTQLNELMNLCCEMGEDDVFSFEGNNNSIVVECPLCGSNITNLSEESRQVHTNDCLDKAGGGALKMATLYDENKSNSQQVADANPVIEWLRSLGFSKYEEAFIKEEVDWETLQWLTEEDLLNIGVVALGPRKKIVHALNELRQNSSCVQGLEKENSNITTNCNTKTLVSGNKLITEFFQGPNGRKLPCNLSNPGTQKTSTASTLKKVASRRRVNRSKVKDIPQWCCIPGTPFKVDAFRFLRGDCSHWFLTHFHMDHYQGLTRSFCHGKIYCSSITAQLVNKKIGVPWEKLQILPVNQKITIAGVNLTCLDANHCPGSIIILFEPPNGKAVLHTGDFRFSSEMACSSILRSCHVHTLILDTTYCNPQFDFPKQEAVIQFVIEAIQAEAFNPKTLFLIGTYTIGKERLFLEVARLLKKKVYVGAAKLRLLKCLGLSNDDMQWFTENEMESHIHVVPMWTIASFKRMKHISNQYSSRFNLIVAFSPTGWTFGKGKKKTPGRRWQQGTIIRYEVPYSEHCSFTELKDFVHLLSPDHIIPSVKNEGLESADAMISLLLSDT